MTSSLRPTLFLLGSVLGVACGTSAESPALVQSGGAGGAAATPSASAGTAGIGEGASPPLYDEPAAGTGGSGEPTTPGDEAVSGELPIDGEVTPPSVPDAGTTEPEVEQGPLTIWIAGDSTVANGQTPCPRGWGGVFAPHFDDRVTINNSAAGGRSVNTWLYEVQPELDDATGECALARDGNGVPRLQPRWQAMLDGMKAGDYLFIQFGINDGDPSCDRHVGLEEFQRSYGMMAQAAKERGAHPVFLTPVSMVACNGNTARGSRGAFVDVTIEAGLEFDVPVIDLHARSVALFQSLNFCPIPGGDVSASTTGPVGDFFCDDHTHFSSAGAVVIADVVASAIAEQNIPLAAYLR